MSPINAPTIGAAVSRYPASMRLTIKTVDGRHSLTGLIGQNQPSVTDGRGGWQEVARARKPSVIEWLGPASHKATVEVLLDATVDHIQLIRRPTARLDRRNTGPHISAVVVDDDVVLTGLDLLDRLFVGSLR